MAIEQMPNFNSPGQPQPGQYGAPPEQSAPGGWGAPPAPGGYGAAPAPGGYGAPPAPGGYGAPPAPGGYGAPPPAQPGAFPPPPGGYGAPPDAGPAGGMPGAYGAPPAAAQGGFGYGGPPPDATGGMGGPPPGAQQIGGFQGAAGAAGAAALANVGNPMGPLVAGAKPTVRNPIMTFAIPVALAVGGSIVGSILAHIAGFLALIGTLISLGGLVLGAIYAIAMLRELQNYTQDNEFVWWWILIPFLGIYFAWIKVPEQVSKAKMKAGILQTKPTRSLVFYVFLFLYALALDLNDLAQS